MRLKTDNRFHKLEVAMHQVQADIKDIKKMAGKETQDRIEALEEFATYADNLLTQLNHALPDTPEPKPKQLDQSVFDGLDAKWRFAAVDRDGAVFVFVKRPDLHCTFWGNADSTQFSRKSAKGAYDKTDWQNSLIERDKVELTGSDLCRAMLERGDKAVLCAVSDDGNFEADAYDAICRVDEDGLFESHCSFWWYVRPVNNQGEPLTATDVGL